MKSFESQSEINLSAPQRGRLSPYEGLGACSTNHKGV